MKRITKTTEHTWKCPYCGFLNDLQNTTCEKCGSIRKGDEVVQEITTNYEETTTTTEGNQPSNYVINYTRITIIGIAAALLIIAAIVFFFSNRATPVNYNNENYKIQ